MSQLCISEQHIAALAESESGTKELESVKLLIS